MSRAIGYFPDRHQLAKGRIRLLLALLLTCFFVILRPAQCTDTGENAQSILSASPDGKFLLRRRQAESGERGEARKSLEICSAAGKILYAWVSPLGATTALWCPDGRYLAVNDMPGENGDQLRLFFMDSDKISVAPLREPDGRKLRSEVESRHGSFLSKVETVSLRGMDWREGLLWCQLNGSFTPKRQPSIHVPFHHLWVFVLNGSNPPVLKEEWTRTDPREKPVRDAVE